ncbi:hypothetical protein ACFX11_041185 [Malus domestica]
MKLPPKAGPDWQIIWFGLRSNSTNSSENESLVEAAIRVLNTAHPFEKARVGESKATQWLRGTTTRAYDPSVNLSLRSPHHAHQQFSLYFSIVVVFFARQMF